MHTTRLTLEDRLSLILGLDRREARTCLRHPEATDLVAIARRSYLEFEDLQHLVSEPEEIVRYRVDPNRLAQSQWERIADFEHVTAKVPRGRPFYSLDEVSQTTGLPLATVDGLFKLPPLHWFDKPANNEKTFATRSNLYIVEGTVDQSSVAETGFVVEHPRTGEIAVARPYSFEMGADADALKFALPGAVHPVLVDGQGFERYLAPGLIDVWLEVSDAWAKRDVFSGSNLAIRRANEQLGHYVVEVVNRPSNGDVARAVVDVISDLNRMEIVKFAEPYQFDPQSQPNPEISVMLDEFEAGDRDWNLRAVNLEAAHAITTGSPNVTVFVVDSGARMDHPDLNDRFRPDWENLDLHYALDAPAEFTSPDERVISHGTKVVGVVAGLSAIAPGCRVVPLKVAGSPGGIDQPGYSLRAEAILASTSYLRPRERGVLNLSWRTNGEVISVREALRTAAEQGMVICASAGNYAGGEQQQPDALHYPSGHAWLEPINHALISVGALAPGNLKATYSYYGADSVTIMAPGGERGESGWSIFTTSTPGRFSFTYGTSFASPHVAGVAALVLSVASDLRPEDVKSLLHQTAVSVDGENPVYAGLLGGGGLDAGAAVKAAKARSAIEGPGDPTSDKESQAIDLNLADESALASVSGIGWYRARRIVRHRAERGPFMSVSELLMTGVFTPAELADLRTRLRIGRP